jgi:hypothetical protein
MASINLYSNAQSSAFLQLPREIRDLIYKLVLVQDGIPIECAFTKTAFPHTNGSDVSTLEHLDTSYPLRTSRVHRRIWTVPTFDVGILKRGPNTPSTVSMTYQLAQNTENISQVDIGVRLLQTCKQIYAEASKVFYGSNIFSFTADYRIPTAFAFLCDRPPRSLLLIKTLELALMEGNNMMGTSQAHYPQRRRSTDSLVLQYAYNYFTELCTLLSTSRIQLRKLYLTVETMNAPGRVPPPLCIFAHCLSYEISETASPRPWIPSWLGPLLNLEGLDSTEILWISETPRLQRIADTVMIMRQNMLRSYQGQHNSESSSTVYFRMLAKINENIDVAFWKSNEIIPCTNEWKDCVLDSDGLRWQEVEPPIECKPSALSEARPHIREILATHTSVYVGHYFLKST